MNGNHFIEKLQSLGYPKASQMQGDNFDWMFENKAVLPFLDWFCSCVDITNVLQPSEIERFLNLSSSDSGILEGPQLEEFLQTCPIINDTSEEAELRHSLEEDTLEEDLKSLEKDLQNQKERLQKLYFYKDKLSVHHIGLGYRVIKLDKITSRVKRRQRKTQEQIIAVNTQMNNVLGKMLDNKDCLSAISETAEDSERSLQEKTTHSPAFLSHLSFNPFFKAEEIYTEELKFFIQKQFFDAMPAITESHDPSKYQLLRINDPGTLLIKGVHKDEYLSNCQELARLQNIYPMSEIQRINALLLKNCNETLVNHLKEMMNDKLSVANSSDLSHRLRNLQIMQSTLKKECDHLVEINIPLLIQQESEQKAAQIITGDYELKIIRQDYFISKQDQVIEYLTNQRTRNEFLMLSLAVETQSHKDTNLILKTLLQETDASIQLLQSRLIMMSELYQKQQNEDHDINPFNVSASRIYKTVSDSRYKKSYPLLVTSDHLLSGCESQQHRLNSLQTKYSSTFSQLMNHLSDLQCCLQQGEKAVFFESTTKAGQLVSSPKVISDSLNNLDTALMSLEKSLRDVFKEHSSKKNLLKNDNLLQMERNLFVYFFTKPKQLPDLLQDLKNKIDDEKNFQKRKKTLLK